MKRTDYSILLFIIFYTIVIISFAIIGERRPDVYVSISILMYFIYISLDSTIKENCRLKVLSIFLFIVFMIIVIYRVLDILKIRVF